MTDETAPVCYICYDGDVTTPSNPLMRSPCNECNLHVHRSCLDRHFIRAAIKDKCVLMRVDADGVMTAAPQGQEPTQHIVYASCTVCKRRFEYRSKMLIDTLKGMNGYVRSLAARVLTLETSQDDASTTDDARLSQAMATVSGGPETVTETSTETHMHTHSRMMQLHLYLAQMMEQMTPEEFAKEMAHCIRFLRYAAAIGVGCAAFAVAVAVHTTVRTTLW